MENKSKNKVSISKKGIFLKKNETVLVIGKIYEGTEVFVGNIVNILSDQGVLKKIVKGYTVKWQYHFAVDVQVNYYKRTNEGDVMEERSDFNETIRAVVTTDQKGNQFLLYVYSLTNPKRDKGREYINEIIN